jgi:hypothetical protein
MLDASSIRPPSKGSGHERRAHQPRATPNGPRHCHQATSAAARGDAYELDFVDHENNPPDEEWLWEELPASRSEGQDPCNRWPKTASEHAVSRLRERFRKLCRGANDGEIKRALERSATGGLLVGRHGDRAVLRGRLRIGRREAWIWLVVDWGRQIIVTVQPGWWDQPACDA